MKTPKEFLIETAVKAGLTKEDATKHLDEWANEDPGKLKLLLESYEDYAQYKIQEFKKEVTQ